MPRARRGWGGDLPSPHIWLTLGYRAVRQGDGESVIEWDATPDYCFHAPTLSFPLAGTRMVEPTESEPLKELDRFCDAMIAIRDEIRKVENGSWPREDNPLKAAPHTAEALLKAEWPHAYTREEAAYPVKTLRQQKYWSPVGRVDNVYGDRNLFCSCIPLSAYES